jgi:hypothetical protein
MHQHKRALSVLPITHNVLSGINNIIKNHFQVKKRVKIIQNRTMALQEIMHKKISNAGIVDNANYNPRDKMGKNKTLLGKIVNYLNKMKSLKSVEVTNREQSNYKRYLSHSIISHYPSVPNSQHSVMDQIINECEQAKFKCQDELPYLTRHIRRNTSKVHQCFEIAEKVLQTHRIMEEKQTRKRNSIEETSITSGLQKIQSLYANQDNEN